jgi:hypothetical protein
LIVRKDRPFSITEFERRERASILGLEVALARAPDPIVNIDTFGINGYVKYAEVEIPERVKEHSPHSLASRRAAHVRYSQEIG